MESLRRDDKWFLGGGSGSIYAPRFPKWLHVPGFWDECYFADLRFERLFTVIVLDEGLRPVGLRFTRSEWTPAGYSAYYEAPGFIVEEERVVTKEHAFVSRLIIQNLGEAPRTLHLVQWSLQERKTLAPETTGVTICGVHATEEQLRFALRYQYGQSHGTLNFALTADMPRRSFLIDNCESTDPSPNWWITPLPEKLVNGRLPNTTAWDAGWYSDGQIHLAAHYELVIPAGEKRGTAFIATVAYEEARASAAATSVKASDPIERAFVDWQDYMDCVPRFECDDPFLNQYYRYRWYGIRLMSVDVGEGVYRHPCVFEGIDHFRSYITYSAQCHMREAAWMHDPALAEGSLLGEIHNQLESGSFKGHIYSWRPDRGFYHANWGASALHVYAIHRNHEFLREVYKPLAKYVEYFDRERDREGMHLYDVIDQGETGQEYMSRYLFVDERADEWGPIRLKGVDSTYYIYELQKALATIADILGEDSGLWRRAAGQTRDAVRSLMWDPEMEFFCDVRPDDCARSPYKSALCFYPFWGDLAGREHLPMIRKHLLNPKEFWTEWPVPASSVDDPYFSAEGEWKGKRTNCPWNGRVWPMTNSHVAEALAHAARVHDSSLRELAAAFTMKFVRMMFYDGDPHRPNCFEHYNPFTGMPCLYRGVDDYQHSWVGDLILTQVVGLVPRVDNKLVIDPLPFSVSRFKCDHVRYAGHELKVEWCGADGMTVWVDGAVRAHSAERGKIEVEL